MKAKDLILALNKMSELQGAIHDGKVMLEAGFYATAGIINPKKKYYYTFKQPIVVDADVIAKTSEGKDIWMFSID